MPVLSGLKPESVFSYFEKLCAVPHGSGNTQIISDLCVSFARELGLKCRQEDCGNVVIWKNGSALPSTTTGATTCAFRSSSNRTAPPAARSFWSCWSCSA